MSDQSKAWVWSQYQGIITQNTAKPAKPTSNEPFDEERVVPFKPIKQEAFDSKTGKAINNRTKYGIMVAVAVLSGMFLPLISIFLLVIAGLLIASGREPKKTEELMSSLPGGNYAISLLYKIDSLLT